MQYLTISLALPLLLASQAIAICPGFNYGIGNVQNEGKLGDSDVSRCK